MVRTSNQLFSASKDNKLGTSDVVVAAIKSVGLVAGNPSAIKITLKTAVPLTDNYLLTITGQKDT